MKLLVTGGAGFIGSHFVDFLLKQPEVKRIGVIDSFHPFYSPEIKMRRVRKWAQEDKVHFFQGDLCNSRQLKEALAFCKWDAVVHFAAVPGVRPSLIDPVSYVETNVKGTVQLLHLMQETKVKNLINISSSSVYGGGAGQSQREEQECRPLSPYAASKWSAEQFCQTFQSLYGFNITTLRPFTVYGPDQRPDMAILQFIRKLNAGEKITLYDPRSSRDYTYVEDVVRAVWLALNKLEGYQVYNVGSGKPVSLISVIQEIARQLNVEPKMEIVGKQMGDVDHTWADLSRIRENLGYEPKVSFAEGIKRTIAWLEKEGMR